MIDGFMGDQTVGYFVPLYAPANPRNAIATDFALLRATGNLVGQKPWIRSAWACTPVRRCWHRRSGRRIARAHRHRRERQRGRPARVGRRCGRTRVLDAASVASGLEHPGERRELVLKGVSAPVHVEHCFAEISEVFAKAGPGHRGTRLHRAPIRVWRWSAIRRLRLSRNMVSDHDRPTASSSLALV
jgi:hypothetical protein